MKKILYLFTITAFLMAVFTTCNKGVTGVKLNETSLTLEIGETKTLVATVSPKNAENKEVMWISSDPWVATVTPTGVVKALSKGVTTITAITEGCFRANCNVQVVTPDYEKLLIQPDGWLLTSGTINPPFSEFDDDVFGFLYPCEFDDIIYFKPNKTQVLKYGEELCDGQTGEEEVLGNWNLSNNGSLSFYFLDYRDPVDATILTLNATTLKLVFRIELGKKDSTGNSRWNSNAKNGLVFTLTYSRAF
jgi:hypothetical protein